ncbi:PAS domain-containing protein [Aerococcaceae bacterium DSM 111020]|nr:PAS domain-containing protein [Aerococcaceae bacterium DSM 111020]
MKQTETHIAANQSPTALQEEVNRLPENSKSLVIQENNQSSNQTYGDRSLLNIYNYSLNRQKLNEKNSIQTGETFDGYWVYSQSAVLQDNNRLIYWFPKDSFKSFVIIFRWLFVFFLVILSCLVYGAYRSIMAMVGRPLDAMNQALLSLDDLSGNEFEYIGNHFKELDTLGETVANIENRISRRYTDLVNSQQRLTILLDHLNLGVILIDSDGEIELFNPEATEILGLTTDSYGRTYAEVVRSTQLVDMIETVIDSQTGLTEEIELYLPTSRYIDVNIIPYKETEEAKGAILVLLYDISRIQQLEKIRSEFVTNASHELRTPVTAIKGFAETLNDGALEDEKIAKEFIQIILKESNRLENIINDILELSRIKKNNEVAQSVFNIDDAVNNILVSLDNKAVSKNIKLIPYIDNTSPLILEGDQHRVEQILTNLVDNAINYSGEGSNVIIRAYGVASGVMLEVADNGVGIPEEEQKRIFERFYRVDKGRSRNSGGTGLGLSIVRNLVRIFGGEINVKSKLGEGSTFSVFLPYFS